MKSKYFGKGLLSLLVSLTLMFAAVSCAGVPHSTDETPPAGASTSLTESSQASSTDQADLNALNAAYYELKLKELIDARNAAVEAGAELLVPDFLLEADNAADDAGAKYLANDYQAAKEDADRAILMYTALKTGLEAYKLWEEMAGIGFEYFNPSDITLADETLMSAASYYSGGNYISANDKAEAAKLQYSAALEAAWKEISAGKLADAAAARQRALDLRANVSVKQDFDYAEALFTQANSALWAQNYDEASRLFIRCEPMFTASAAAALEKRQAAEEALWRADQRLAESDEIAKNAELILEEGGIE
jgi:hypothetical protein